MHNGLDDKRRRRINLRDRRVEEVLPEHFAQDYPKFISLLESYYEFENENNPTELLDHLFETRDISQTDLDLLSFIEDELLLGEAYFEGFPDKRAAAQFSSILFRAKGSKYSIEWFFRAFFGEDAEVLYPKSDIFNVGQSEIGPDSLKFITDDKLYQTFALLIRSGRPLDEWKDIYKLFVHPAGMYLGAETVLNLVGETGSEADSAEPTQRLTPAYSLTGGSGNEGTTASVTVSGTNSLDTNLRYVVEHLTTSPDDFVTPPPTSLDLAGDVVILSNAGSVDFSYATDTPVIPLEGTEVFAFKLYDYEGRLLDSANVDIFDVLPTYTVTVDTTSVTEGGSITGNVASDIPANEVITLSITGAASGDARIDAPGTVTMSSSPQPFSISTSFDALPNGSVTGSVQASSAFDVASDGFTLIDAAAVYELRVDNTSLGENSGTPFLFDIGPGASNIPDGSYNFWLIAPADGTSAVFTGGSRDLSFNGGDAPTSSSRLAVTITNNQISNVTGLGAVTSIPIDVVDDLAITGDLEFRGVIGTTGGVARDTTTDLTITDNDVAVTYTVATFSDSGRTTAATTFTEGDTIYGRVTTAGTALSETVTVEFTTNSDARLVNGTNPNNITTFTNTAAGDYDFTYVITSGSAATDEIYQGDPSVSVRATSSEDTNDLAITINDAAPTYTIQGSDPLTVSEVASAQTITVNTTNIQDGTFLYWNITTDAPGSTEATTDWAAYNSGGTGFEINSNTGTFDIDALADAFTDGSTETFYLHVRTGSDAGTSVDSIELQVTDDSQSGPTYSLSGSTSISEPQAPINYYSVATQNLTGTPAGTPPVKATLTQNVTSLDVMHAKIGGETIAVNISGTKSNGIYQGTYTNTNVTTTANSDYLNEPSNWGNLTYNKTDFTVTDNWSDDQATASRPAVGPNVGGLTYGTTNFTDPEFYLTFKTQAAGTYNQYISGLATGTDNLGDGDVAKFTGSVTIAGENTYTVTTAGVSNGTNLYWECESVSGFGSNNFVAGYTDNGIATSDVAGKLRGRVTINSNSGTFNVRLDHDATSTSSPTFNIKLYSNSGYTTLVDTLGPVTINNSTKYISAAFDVGSINEDATATATYTLTTSGVTNGTTVGYTIRSLEGNISLSDILVSTDNVNFSTPTQFFGTLTINSNTANLYFRAAADSVTETTQKIIIDIDETDNAGTNTYAYERLNGSTETRYGAGNNTSAVVTINDTSQGSTFNLSGGTFQEDINVAQQADAGVSFNSNGTVTKTNSNSSGTIGADDWINAGSQAAGVGNDYQILFTTSSGSDPTVTVGGTVNGSYVYGTSWIGLDGNNSIECIVSAGDFPNADASVVSVTIKEWDGVTANLGTGTTVAGPVNYTLEADNAN